MLYLCSFFLTLIPYIVVTLFMQYFCAGIQFAGSKLPKDDGEFYQFCYVAASGQVRGASPPFQFKHPMTDDLIEIEDENGELLVIRTKTAVLEDQLKKANENRAELKQVRSTVFHLVYDIYKLPYRLTLLTLILRTVFGVVIITNTL